MTDTTLSTENLLNALGIAVVVTENDRIAYMSLAARDILLPAGSKAQTHVEQLSDFFVDNDPRHQILEFMHCKSDQWTSEKKLLKAGNGAAAPVIIRGLLLDASQNRVLYSLDWYGFNPKRLGVDTMSMVVEYSPVSIAVTDLNGRILYVNQKFEEQSGYSKGEVINQHSSMLKSGFHTPAFYAELWQTIRNNQVWKGQLLNRKKDGKLFWELVTIQPIEGFSGTIEYFVAIKEDVTEKKALEEAIQLKTRTLEETIQLLKNAQAQMLQQEKMASVGQLAAGVAHEINNPLGFITSNISTLAGYVKDLWSYVDQVKAFAIAEDEKNDGKFVQWVEEKEKAFNVDYIREDFSELLADVTTGLDRVGKIVQGLRNFSRIDQVNEMTEYDLNEGVATTLLLVNNELKYDAQIVTHFASNIPQVNANGGQINQVILNILLNAVQAIRENKKENEIGLIDVYTDFMNGYVFLRVSDTGPGVPESVLDRVFEPFFTTKPAGFGTGLGLSICYDIIVNKHQGYIHINNNTDIGATVEMGLPLNLSSER